MDCAHTDAAREWFSNFRGGMTFFLGCHLIDMVYSIMGEPDEVIPLNTCSHIRINEGEDIGFALFRYGNAYSFIKACAVEPGGFIRRQLVVVGEKGAVEIKPIERWYGKKIAATSRSISEQDVENGWNSEGTTVESEQFDRYGIMMRSFAELVRGERENPYTPDYELSLYRLILKACGV